MMAYRPSPRSQHGCGPSGRLRDNRRTLPLGACRRTHSVSSAPHHPRIYSEWSSRRQGGWVAAQGRVPEAERKGCGGGKSALEAEGTDPSRWVGAAELVHLSKARAT
jgi:hypothetical protein